MLVDHGQFARAPFETCWIEFPAPDFHEMLNHQVGEDDRVGYLFHGDHVYVGSSTSDKRSNIIPVRYNLHQPMAFHDEIALSEKLGISRMFLDDFYWGRTFSENFTQPMKRALRSQHSFYLHVEENRYKSINSENVLFGMAGELRNILGILLMINQPRNILDIVERLPRKTMTHRGYRNLVSHSVVEINLDDRDLRPLMRVERPHGTHAAPRWHQVRGHYCHDRDTKIYGEIGCVHVWKEIKPLNWECDVCGGRRWWRKACERGDKSLGLIEQNRVVSTNNDAIPKAIREFV